MRVKKTKPSIIEKIQKISHEKWFDFSKTVAPVIIGGIFGVCIAHHYQVQDEIRGITIKTREEARVLSLNITDLLAQRRFYAVRAAWAFQSKKEEKIVYDEYDKKIKEWNDHLSSNLILLKRYFGEGRIKELATILTKMNELHQDLLNAKNLFLENKPVPDFNPKGGVIDKLYALDEDVSKFGDNLQEQLQSGHVDVYKPEPPLKQPKN